MHHPLKQKGRQQRVDPRPYPVRSRTFLLQISEVLRRSGHGSGPPTGCLAQNCSIPCPAYVTNVVCAAIAVPSGDSPIGQWHVATGTPVSVNVWESQAKLQQFAIVLPRPSCFGQKR
jgi:hypothetical protein